MNELASKFGVKIGSINPNVFQDQEYRLGSLCNPNVEIREHACRHVTNSIRLGQSLDSEVVTLWLADGTNYTGQGSIRAARGYSVDPLITFREGGYLAKISAERRNRREALGISVGGSYA